mmetsp:Transcript_22689/g.71359  ORF Transcript_22689/g.71359 Transcript_22689/m.71359 type:complete len:282 (+) Transcript_22689:770-1615(+)
MGVWLHCLKHLENSLHAVFEPVAWQDQPLLSKDDRLPLHLVAPGLLEILLKVVVPELLQQLLLQSHRLLFGNNQRRDRARSCPLLRRLPGRSAGLRWLVQASPHCEERPSGADQLGVRYGDEVAALSRDELDLAEASLPQFQQDRPPHRQRRGTLGHADGDLALQLRLCMLDDHLHLGQRRSGLEVGLEALLASSGLICEHLPRRVHAAHELEFRAEVVFEAISVEEKLAAPYQHEGLSVLPRALGQHHGLLQLQDCRPLRNSEGARPPLALEAELDAGLD